MNSEPMEYDVCLSFAGEDRVYVREVARHLSERGTRVFFDEYETSSLWGKDLYQHLDSVYRKRALFCVVFVSQWYAGKLWTKHELRSAQARAFSENAEYILPARFDDTELPGLLPTTGYVDLRMTPPVALAEYIISKVNGSAPDTPSTATRKVRHGLEYANIMRARLRKPR